MPPRFIALLMLAAPSCAFAQSAFDGTWRADPASMVAVAPDGTTVPAEPVAEDELTITMTVRGGRLHQTTGRGSALDAEIGGAYAPVRGDSGGTTTRVERTGPRALGFTNKRAGKVVSTASYAVGEDGVLRGSWRDVATGISGRFTARRQSPSRL